MSKDDNNTHFGFQQVPLAEKASLVGKVFSSVARNYDIMNDLMSFGVHRIWKKFAVSQSALIAGGNVLDLAAGSGDLSSEFAKQVGPKGQVVMTDINPDMLAEGKKRMLNQGLVGNIDFKIMDAEQIEFEDNTFDCVSISFGLRNVTDKEKALSEMARVIRPGGRVLVLEFSKPVLPILEKLYDLYSFNVIPKLGKWVANDEPSYQYLVESIRQHPDQEVLKHMMLKNGCDEVVCHNLSGGIVALHVGYKY